VNFNISINIVVSPRTTLLSYIYFGTSGYFRESQPPPGHVRLLCSIDLGNGSLSYTVCTSTSQYQHAHFVAA